MLNYINHSLYRNSIVDPFLLWCQCYEQLPFANKKPLINAQILGPFEIYLICRQNACIKNVKFEKAYTYSCDSWDNSDFKEVFSSLSFCILYADEIYSSLSTLALKKIIKLRINPFALICMYTLDAYTVSVLTWLDLQLMRLFPFPFLAQCLITC